MFISKEANHLVIMTNVHRTHPETRPIPVIIPPAGTSSFPYNSYAANWENSKKGVLQEIKWEKSIVIKSAFKCSNLTAMLPSFSRLHVSVSSCHATRLKPVGNFESVETKNNNTLDPVVCLHALLAGVSHEKYGVVLLSLLHLGR